MDHELTKSLGRWLQTPAAERNLSEGANLFLRLSGNNIMYRGFMRNLAHSAKMIEYQLQKYYNFRVKELTKEQVADMQRQVNAIAVKDKLAEIPAKSGESGSESTPAKHIEEIRKGKRPDHDSLPEEIRSLYVENLTILQKMRSLHSKLELLSTENAVCPDSERYPFLKEIIDLDKKYHENWNTYDHYRLSSAPEQVAKKPSTRKSTTRKAKK